VIVGVNNLKFSICFAAVGAVLAFIMFFWLALKSPGHLYIEMSNDNGGEGQVYVDSGKGYRPEGGKTFALMPDGKIHTYGIDIRSSIPNAIRVDPGATAGNIKIGKVTFENPLFVRQFSCDDIRLLHALRPVQAGVGNCVLTADEGDPYFDFDVVASRSLNLRHIKWQAIAEAFAYAAITFLLIVEVSRRRNCQATSKEKWLTNTRCMRLYAILAFGFISFIFLNLHVSSIDEWKNYVSTDIRSGIIFGFSRPVRSDEWREQTPFYASQTAHGFALNNPSLGAKNVTLAATVPVKGIYGYTQPRFWGFYLMEFERGFSWLYAWRVFGLVLSGFILFSILTKGDFWLSLTGSVWISLSPFMQWWFGTNLPDMVIGFAGGVSSLYLLLRAASLRTLILASVALFFAGISFVSALYPAFLLPLFYLALFLVGGLSFRDRLDRSFINQWRQKTPFLLLAIGGILWILAVWHHQSSGIIDLVQNSVYPGKRIALGGDMSFSSLLSGLFSPFLRVDQFPLELGNVCNASNFLLLFPLAWMVMLRRYQKTRQFDPLALAISFYILLMLVWMFVGYPEWIAKTTKMSMSPPLRSLLGLGLASILVTVIVFAEHVSESNPLIGKTENTARLLMFSVSLVASICIALWLRSYYPEYVTWRMLVLLLPVLALWFCSYLIGAREWLVVITIPLVLPGIAVNPLAHGVSSLKNAELSSFLMEDQLLGETRWLVIPDLQYPQYFKANGAMVWNGTRFISDPGEMRILDPTDRYRDVWNRYAHFGVSPLPLGSPAEFELIYADSVMLKVDLCSEAVSSLGINRFAFLTQPGLDQFPCLELLRHGPVAGTWLYKKKDTVGGV
jgi:hypothetical protein